MKIAASLEKKRGPKMTVLSDASDNPGRLSFEPAGCMAPKLIPESTADEIRLRIERAMRESALLHKKQESQIREDYRKRGLFFSSGLVVALGDLLLDQLRQDLKSIWSESFDVVEAMGLQLANNYLSEISQEIVNAWECRSAQIQTQMTAIEKSCGIRAARSNVDERLAQIKTESLADCRLRYHEHQRKGGTVTNAVETWARVLKVMIASPADVDEERNIAREVVYEWNAMHCDNHRIVLLPIGWESHSYPTMGNRPQAIINAQLVATADILVAVFWTRLGSPTGIEDSGTVEEINRHAAAGKPAMLYFSKAPVSPDSLHYNQYEALKNFRQQCKNNSLFAEYDDTHEFRKLFARQLAQLVASTFSSMKSEMRPANNTTFNLSEEGVKLLSEASRDRDGAVLALQSFSGFTVQTHGTVLHRSKEARSNARWQAAIDELENAGFLEDRGGKREVFFLTDRGFRASESIRPESMDS